MSAVLSETRAAVAWITLNRPDAMNAINEDIRERLPAALLAADADPAVRVIVVQGAGPRAFCAGADIKGFVAVESPPAYRQSRVHHHWIHAFDQVRKPIVAAIHGYCLGGGFEIALACDVRIAARDAKFAFPETGHGIIPGAGGTQRITRVLGLGLALDLVLSGERIDAERAYQIGIVSRLCDTEALAEEARVYAEKIAAKPPLAIMFAKEAVRTGRELELTQGLRLESDLITHLANTADRLEAAQAFREKRPPKFSGN